LISLRSVGVTEAVSATTGMRAAFASARICRNASMPLMPGSWNVHQHQVGQFLLRQLHAFLARDRSRVL